MAAAPETRAEERAAARPPDVLVPWGGPSEVVVVRFGAEPAL